MGWMSPAGGWMSCSGGRCLLLKSSSSQCNALDRLAPDCLSRHLKRWLWPNSLRCSPYTNLPAQCSPPSSKEVTKSSFIIHFIGICYCAVVGVKLATNGALKRFANIRAVKSPGQIERDETSGQPVLFLGHGGQNRCHIGRTRNTLCKVGSFSCFTAFTAFTILLGSLVSSMINTNGNTIR